MSKGIDFKINKCCQRCGRYGSTGGYSEDKFKIYNDPKFHFSKGVVLCDDCIMDMINELEEIEKKNNTNIQFHEGDYVENKNGKIGYISSICHCDECKKRGFFEPTITYSDGTTDYISNYSVKTVSSDYKQIGTQKFSTEDVLRNRITALEKENKELKEKVNHLTERNHELLVLYCFYDMERNGTKQ